MALVALFGVLQAAVLIFWSIPAVGRWFARYVQVHPEMIDAEHARERLARSGLLAVPSSFKYIASFLRALLVRDVDDQLERLRSQAVLRLGTYLVFLVLGLPVMLMIAATIRELIG